MFVLALFLSIRAATFISLLDQDGPDNVYNNALLEILSRDETYNPANNETGNGSGNGTDNGSGNGTDNGSGNGTDNGSGNETDNGSSGNGTGNGSGNGTDNGSGNGTDNGSGNGTGNGSGNGTDNGSGNGTRNGSISVTQRLVLGAEADDYLYLFDLVKKYLKGNQNEELSKALDTLPPAFAIENGNGNKEIVELNSKGEPTGTTFILTLGADGKAKIMDGDNNVIGGSGSYDPESGNLVDNQGRTTNVNEEEEGEGDAAFKMFIPGLLVALLLAFLL